ncbi:MAG: PAS domain S-box protein [Chloroflexi bacterium]|nr:PAS domain S-box protein [Chloroflexota bacterium]
MKLTNKPEEEPLTELDEVKTKTEDALSMSEARLTGIINSAMDAIITINAEQRIEVFNTAAEQMFRCSAVQALGQRVERFIPQRFRQDHAHHIQHFGQTGTTNRNMHSLTVLKALRSTGEEFPIEATISQVETAGQKLYTVIIRDITERKQAEERLHFLTIASQVLASSLDYSIILPQLARLAASLIGNLCLIEVLEQNDSTPWLALACTDPLKEEILLEIQRSYSLKLSHSSSVAQVLSTGQPEIKENISEADLVAMADDEQHLELLRKLSLKSYLIVPLVIREQVLGVLCFASTEPEWHYRPADLTLAQELAQRTATAVDNARLYREAQQAVETQKELNYIRELFMSIVSHELRSPLTAINGYAQYLSDRLRQIPEPESETSRKVNAKILRSVQVILQQSNRMNDLINQLLNFSRLRNGKFELNYVSGINLVELVQRVMEQHQQAAKDHTLTVQTSEEQILVDCDEARLEQVLNNLISNAIKYSNSGTTIIAGIERQPLAHSPELLPPNLPNPNKEAIIWIRDQGQGISAENQTHLFDRFYRVRTRENVKVEGLGLGLYISYEIVKQHGGRMWLESQPGEGTTFYFSVPFEAKDDFLI